MSFEIASRIVIKGYVSGALFMLFFGEFWASVTTLGLTTLERVLLYVVMLTVAVVLLLNAVFILRAARGLPDNPSPEAASRGKSISQWFAIVVTVETIAIVLASVLLGRADRGEFIPLAIGLIVGVHFLPLAYIFHVRVYYFTGLLMSLLALAALIALFLRITLGGPYAWAMVVGFGNALILWSTAFYVLSVGKRLLRSTERSS